MRIVLELKFELRKYGDTRQRPRTWDEKTGFRKNKDHLDLRWRSNGSISLHHFAILVDQELGKVPFDAVAKESSLL